MACYRQKHFQMACYRHKYISKNINLSLSISINIEQIAFDLMLWWTKSRLYETIPLRTHSTHVYGKNACTDIHALNHIQCNINIDILQLDTQGYPNSNHRNPFIFFLVFNTNINLYCEHFEVLIVISVKQSDFFFSIFSWLASQTISNDLFSLNKYKNLNKTRINIIIHLYLNICCWYPKYRIDETVPLKTHSTHTIYKKIKKINNNRNMLSELSAMCFDYRYSWFFEF